MATIETIGTGGDYATPQAWYDAHKGNITADANAPYIGELMRQTFTGGLNMSGSTTDATHYFHLRAAQGSAFEGAFDGSYPVISNVRGIFTAAPVINVGDNYTKLEDFVVTGTNYGYGIYASNKTGLVFDRIGIYNLTGAGLMNGGIHVQGLTAGQTAVIRNCVVGIVEATGAGNNAYGLVVTGSGGNGVAELYNNTVNQILATGSGGEADGIYVTTCASAKIINNAVVVLDADTMKSIYTSGNGVLVCEYNAGEESTGLGTDAVTGWVPEAVFVDVSATSSMNLHLLDGQPGRVGDAGANPLRQAGLNLKKASLYINAPTVDIDGETRGSHIPWNIGADGDAEGASKGKTTTGMLCRKPDGTYIRTTWRLFYPSCPKVNAFCNPLAGAYVAASTVCQQQLW